jgi:hypothetical protein
MSFRSPAQSAESRPKRNATATSKVTDSNNIATPELSAHKEAVHARRIAETTSTISHKQAQKRKAADADLAASRESPGPSDSIEGLKAKRPKRGDALQLPNFRVPITDLNTANTASTWQGTITFSDVGESEAEPSDCVEIDAPESQGALA